MSSLISTMVSPFAMLLWLLLLFCYFGESFRPSIFTDRISLHSLMSKKKKISNVPTKVRVMLKEDLQNIGNKGDIVQVSIPMWMYLLEPRKMADKISDKKYAEIQGKDELESALLLESAKNFSAMALNGNITIERTTGLDGQLFGSVLNRHITDKLSEKFPMYADVVNLRAFTIRGIFNQSHPKENLINKNSVRQSGVYKMEIVAHPQLNAVPMTLVIGDRATIGNTTSPG